MADKKGRYSFVIIVYVVAATLVTVSALALHFRTLYLVASVLAIVIGGVYAWRRFATPSKPGSSFAVFVRGSLIFFGGAAYGVTLWYHDGWQWSGCLYALYPLAIAGLLLWVAFRMRRKARAPGAAR